MQMDSVKIEVGFPVMSDRATETEGDAHTEGDRYHHGDLPNALRRATVEVIDERGLGAFSLREVARRAGVSHTAPAHHFGDMRGLLTSVAVEGFDALHDATLAASSPYDDPADRLRAMGEAYVRLGRSNPAHCQVMFRTDVVDPDAPELQAAGMRSYGVLESAMRDLIDREDLDVDLDEAVWWCWSTMQGLVQLEPKLAVIAGVRGDDEPDHAALAARFSDLIVAGLRNAGR